MAELKSAKIEMRNTFDELICCLDSDKERISKLENMSMKITN